MDNMVKLIANCPFILFMSEAHISIQRKSNFGRPHRLSDRDWMLEWDRWAERHAVGKRPLTTTFLVFFLALHKPIIFCLQPLL